jgi:hypothetical protein
VEVHALEPVPLAVGLEQGGTAAALDADSREWAFFALEEWLSKQLGQKGRRGWVTHGHALA